VILVAQLVLAVGRFMGEPVVVCGIALVVGFVLGVLVAW